MGNHSKAVCVVILWKTLTMFFEILILTDFWIGFSFSHETNQRLPAMRLPQDRMNPHFLFQKLKTWVEENCVVTGAGAGVI